MLNTVYLAMLVDFFNGLMEDVKVQFLTSHDSFIWGLSALMIVLLMTCIFFRALAIPNDWRAILHNSKGHTNHEFV